MFVFRVMRVVIDLLRYWTVELLDNLSRKCRNQVYLTIFINDVTRTLSSTQSISKSVLQNHESKLHVFEKFQLRPDGLCVWINSALSVV